MAHTRPLSLLLSGLLLAACSGNVDRADDGDVNPNPVEAKLVGLNVSAGGLQHEVGTRITVTAEALYDDSTRKDITGDVTWGVGDNTLLEAVDGIPNEFVARAEGRVSITAGYEGLTKTIEVTLTAPSLTSLKLFPAEAQICMGGVLTVAVVGVYSNGSEETVTDLVTFESDAQTVLRPSNEISGRLVTFGTEGAATITARLGAQVVRGTYSVGAACIFNLAVGAPSERIGDTPLQFSAEAAWTDSRPRTNETANVTWTSSDPAIVSIDANGLATRVTDGEVVISASVPASTIGGAVRLKTLGASVCGDYPTVHAAGLTYDDVAAPMFWRDAYTETGELVDFFLEDLPCDTQNYQTVLFVIGTGWCPYCPAFKQGIDAMQAQLDEAGMRVVYVEAETDGGAPAGNDAANQIINRSIGGSTNPSIRMGDLDAEGGASLPFRNIVQYYPYAVVIRTSDMEVIAAGQGHNFLTIAQDPSRPYGVN